MDKNVTKTTVFENKNLTKIVLDDLNMRGKCQTIEVQKEILKRECWRKTRKITNKMVKQS